VSRLHQDIKGVAILIHGTPEILLDPVDGDDGFIKVPGIAQLALPLFQFACIGRAKFQTPAPYRFVGHDDPAFSEEFFDFPKAKAEPMVEPHGVTDNGRRKTMALVADLFGCHAE